MATAREKPGPAEDQNFPCLAIHVMTPGVIQIPGDVTVGEAARLMHKEQVPCLLIKDTEVVIGIVTHSDIVRKVIAQGLNPNDVESRLVMSMPVQYVEFDAPVEGVTTTMASARVPLLIVTRNQHPIGFITARDLLSPPKRHDLPIQGSVKVYNEKPEGVSHPAVITQLGHVGAFVETEAPMPTGARVTVEFALPGSQRPLAAEALVLSRQDQHGLPIDPSQSPTRGVAVQFTDVPVHDQSEISSWILRTRRNADFT